MYFLLQGRGWRADISPASCPASALDFDVIAGANGKTGSGAFQGMNIKFIRVTSLDDIQPEVVVSDFSRKVMRGKLAIAITANFVNRNTQAEMQIREIGGLAFIFDQEFFNNLKMKCGVELENFVYYKNDTHYFVMTVKKHSLLKKGILREDRPNARDLLAPDNRDNSKLKQFALEIADVTTQHRIPNITFEVNHHGEEDIAMFDFTSMSMANHSCFVKKRHDRTLIQTIVGDSLLEVKPSNYDLVYTSFLL